MKSINIQSLVCSLFGSFSSRFLILPLLFLLQNLHFNGIQFLSLFVQVADLRLQILLFNRYVCNVHNLDSLERLLRQQILILTLQHLQGSDLLELLLDEIFSDLYASAHIL